MKDKLPPPTEKCGDMKLTLLTLQADVIAVIKCSKITNLEIVEEHKYEFYQYLDFLYRLKERIGDITPRYYKDILFQLGGDHISLSSQHLGDSGVLALCRGRGLDRAITIALPDNAIGRPGGEAIAERISSSKSLTSVDLHGNNLDSEGGKAIADAISSSESLTSIDLSQNDGGPEFGIEIAKGLAVSKSLTSVNLYENNLGAEGGKAIAIGISV